MHITIGMLVRKKSHKPFANGSRSARVISLCNLEVPNVHNQISGSHVVKAAKLEGITNPIALELLEWDSAYSDYVSNKIAGEL